MQDFEKENRAIRQAARDAQKPLRDSLRRLDEVLGDKWLMENTSFEASTAMECAVEDITVALRLLDAGLARQGPAATTPGGPTRQQGQFLAYIREYMMRNYAGVAPTHAALQKFFNLTPPSVNSMLKRLESRGFIRRIPHQARAIEITIEPELIPPLDRPFKM